MVRKGIMAGTCERENPFTLWWEAKIRMRKGLGSDYSLWGNAIKNPRTLHKPLSWRLPSLPNSTSWRPGLQHGSLWETVEIQTITSTEWDRTSISSLYLLIFRKTSHCPTLCFEIVSGYFKTVQNIRWWDESVSCVCVHTWTHVCACPQVFFLLVKLPVFSHKVIFQWPV